MTELETAAAEYTTKEKKFEEDAAKEKDKFKRLQSLAKKMLQNQIAKLKRESATQKEELSKECSKSLFIKICIKVYKKFYKFPNIFKGSKNVGG